MKALVSLGPKHIVYKDVPQPPADKNEMLVQVKFAGVCGPDIRIYEGMKGILYPRIIGHEFSRVIHELGDNICDYVKGDSVTVYPMLACGKCYECKNGRTNICVNRKTIGYEIDGAFAEYVKIPHSCKCRCNG